LPLSEKTRIEVYLPDIQRPEYQDLLGTLEQEFTYAFGGCTTVRRFEGSYLSRLGRIIRDHINLIYTDMAYTGDHHFDLVARYVDRLRDATFAALEEETVLVVVWKVHHAE
jgi:hypothetical protein